MTPNSFEIREQSRRPSRSRRRRRNSILPPLLALVIGLALGWSLRGCTDTSVPKPPDNPDWITQDFLPLNRYSRPGTKLEEINGIVVHYVGNPGTTAEQNHSYFSNLAKTHEAYASSHFLIGMDGVILQNIPLDEVAYCSNDRNRDTLSIECCHPDDSGQFTPDTYDALVKLVCWLNEYYELTPEQVIRHYDVTGKECPRYHVRNPEAWEQFRMDISAEQE